MAPIPKIHEVHLRKIAEILTDTSPGLTGSEIGEILQSCGIDDPLVGATKRYRLFEALNNHQRAYGVANHVIAFIQAAMNPVRFVGKSAQFEEHRANLNTALSFIGMTLSEDGSVRQVQAAQTLTDADKCAGRLRMELQRRNVHADVLRFCRAELLQENYFHAVFEATKSVADKIRDTTGLTTDGAQLVDEAIGIRSPLLAFNSLQSETERSEHRGIMNLLKGMFGTFRNTTAHAPKIKWVITEQDAMDLLTLASFLHRRLDSAVSTRPNTSI